MGPVWQSTSKERGGIDRRAESGPVGVGTLVAGRGCVPAPVQTEYSSTSTVVAPIEGRGSWPRGWVTL